jgi:hypothetical protein
MDPRMRYGNGYRGSSGLRSISKPRSLRGFRDASGQLVLDHDEENLSEKELYARNIPAIGDCVPQPPTIAWDQRPVLKQNSVRELAMPDLSFPKI